MNLVDIGDGFHAELLNKYRLPVFIYAARRMHEPGQPFWHSDACIGIGKRHTNPLRRILADVSFGTVHRGWLDGDSDMRGSYVNPQRFHGTANLHFVIPVSRHFFIGQGKYDLDGWTVNVWDDGGEFVQGWNHQIDDSGVCAFFLPSQFIR
jgi:hypothetical protein